MSLFKNIKKFPEIRYFMNLYKVLNRIL